ncbi:adenosylcobinamide-phosphate synthase CbiB [Phytohalomonas tamaricis]|uniref:adenosylcobinamide-phosphate synthase CbiB n=1 Tax=Phytohalomonas tamaricis TaxID=2081032 RepID=UPI000D0BA4B2|nr:adenosylcobinamide-phosphate synthase CbiB [Phytohalomonas tamaricis]
MLLISLIVGLCLDRALGEPRRYHPLVGLGNYIAAIEKRLHDNDSSLQRLRGVIAVCLVLLPGLLVAYGLDHGLSDIAWLHAVTGGIIVYIAIGWRSLLEHAHRIAEPLRSSELAQARYHLSMIVSRDTAELTPVQMAAATTESVLENGNDAIFAAIFWFIVGGIPGVVLYRIANTLDAMWGYKNVRYRRFGWAAARLDDVLNWIPARLTAFSYACVSAPLGNFVQALRCWREQGRSWKSPNAGPVMAAGAGALNVMLGGAMHYHGELQFRPALGAGVSPDTASIEAACLLINRTVILWLAVIAILEWIT